MEIRRLTKEDSNAFHLLRLQALHDSPAAFGMTPEEHSLLATEQVLNQIDSERSFLFGAFDYKLLVGMTGVARERGIKRQHSGVVWGVYVSPVHRRSGIGRLLLEGAITHSREIGIQILKLSVNAENDSAKSLYKAYGFEEWGFEPKALKVGESYIDELHMRLELK